MPRSITTARTWCRVPLAAALLWLATGCQGAPASADLVISGVNVVDVAGGTVLGDRTVFVEDGRITAVLAAFDQAAPNGAVTVDATGRYLVPGLWDSHVHSAASTDWHFPLLLAHGVTSVRNMHSTVDDALGLTTSIQQRLASGELMGPRFLANGPIVDGPVSTWPGAVLVETEEQARKAVDSLAAAGADFIKVYDNLSSDAYAALTDQAVLRGIPVDGHVPFAVLPARAAAMQRTAEHLMGLILGCSSAATDVRARHEALIEGPPLPFPDGDLAYFRLLREASDGWDDGACDASIRSYEEGGVAVVPTLVNAWASLHASEVVADSASMALLPGAVRGQWSMMAGPGPGEMIASIMGPVYDRSVHTVGLLSQSTVPILAGTDLGNPFLVPGRHLHQELALLVGAGLSPAQALQAATWNPAVVFGLADSLGLVAEGYLADLVLLDANPLEDITNVGRISGVVTRGAYLDPGALQSLLAAARDPRDGP